MAKAKDNPAPVEEAPKAPEVQADAKLEAAKAEYPNAKEVKRVGDMIVVNL